MDASLFKERLSAAFDLYLGRLVGLLPVILGGLVLLLVGYGAAKLLQILTRRLVGSTPLGRLAERQGLDRVLHRLGGTAEVLGKLVFWLVFLFFILAAAEVADLTVITDGMRSFFGYLPRLLTAAGVLLLGIWLGQKVRTLINGLIGPMGLTGGKVLGQLLFGLIVLFMGITALNMAGVDTTLITSNILIFFGGVLVAFSVAYGMASRDILTNILSSYYGRDRFSVGQTVRIGEDEGVIERIDSISMTLRTKDRTVLIPTSKLITERIEVLDERTAPLERA